MSIASLLKNFPADFVDDKGVKFWTAPKMCPSVKVFSTNDPDSVSFVFHTVNVYCYIFGREYVKSVDLIKHLAEENFTNHFVDKFGRKFNEKGEEIKEDDDADEQLLEANRKELESLQNLSGLLQLVQFEKDDDRNHHIDFIH